MKTRHNINSGQEGMTNHHFNGERPSVVKVKFFGDDVTEVVDDNEAKRNKSSS